VTRHVAQAIAEVFAALGALTRAIGNLVSVILGGHSHQHQHMEGGEFMFIVKDDHADEQYVLSPVVVTDKEGSVVPGAPVTVEVVSDNPSVVAVVPDADPHTGKVTFGSPNADGSPATAGVTATFKAADGTVLGVRGAQFVVTAGDPAAISGGDIGFPGLTEAPVPPTP
jgi:hypothetical protein